MLNMLQLKIEKDVVIEASQELRRTLQPFYDEFPDLFPKPLGEMGISDMVKMSDLLIKFKEVTLSHVPTPSN